MQNIVNYFTLNDEEWFSQYIERNWMEFISGLNDSDVEDTSDTSNRINQHSGISTPNAARNVHLSSVVSNTTTASNITQSVNLIMNNMSPLSISSEPITLTTTSLTATAPTTASVSTATTLHGQRISRPDSFIINMDHQRSLQRHSSLSGMDNATTNNLATINNENNNNGIRRFLHIPNYGSNDNIPHILRELQRQVPLTANSQFQRNVQSLHHPNQQHHDCPQLQSQLQQQQQLNHNQHNQNLPHQNHEENGQHNENLSNHPEQPQRPDQHQHSHQHMQQLPNLDQTPELRNFIKNALKYIPFISILLWKFCVDHMDGIIDFLALYVLFLHSNYILRREIAKQAQRRISWLLREILFILCIFIVIFSVLKKVNLFWIVLFVNTLYEPNTFVNLLFSVILTDLILKLLTICIKIFITILPNSIVMFRGRGRIFLFIEYLSQLYRSLATIQPWIFYFLSPYKRQENDIYLGYIFSAVYLIFKTSEFINRVRCVKYAFKELQKSTRFGTTTPTKDQLDATSVNCPICHDEYTYPVMLECQHIFCDTCIGIWFDSEQTCPLCRAIVAADPLWRDGSTTHFLQVY